MIVEGFTKIRAGQPVRPQLYGEQATSEGEAVAQ